jgi:hypothetical protein
MNSVTKMVDTKQYLGDSVYAAFDGYHIILTTENGYSDDPRNRIALEPTVFGALRIFANEIYSPDSTARSAAEANRFTVDLVRAQGYAKGHLENLLKGEAMVAKVAAQLSESAELNAFGGSFWFTVKNREDVKVLMQIAPLWNKSTHETGIDYDTSMEGVDFRIRTVDAALPPTCKLVEREVTIPASEARTVKRMFVECDKPSTEATEDASNEQL